MGLSITVPTGMKAEYVAKLGGVKYPAFSFRTAAEDIHGTKQGYSKADFFTFPESIEKFFEKDSSSKARDLTYSEFLEEIPCVKIRSYTQDTIASEFFNILGIAIEGFQEGAEFKGNIWEALKHQFGDMFDTAKDLVNAITSEGGLNKFASVLLGGSVPNINLGVAHGQWLVEKLPYALYYSILGSETNFFAELPCYIPTGFFDSNGNYGWPNGSEGFNAAEVGRSSGLGKLKGLMTIAQSFGMNFMPFFKADGRDNGETFTVSFELYNDTKKHAEANYRFLHTLVPHNKWMQYGLSQSPGALYDVQIPGGNRFFMCMCDIKVKMKGALRRTEIKMKDTEIDENISIPDVYSVDLNFSSMFSNNFNNYIYNLAKDMPEIINHRSQGVLDEIIENASAAFKSLRDGALEEAAAKAYAEGNIAEGDKLMAAAERAKNEANRTADELATEASRAEEAANTANGEATRLEGEASDLNNRADKANEEAERLNATATELEEAASQPGATPEQHQAAIDARNAANASRANADSLRTSANTAASVAQESRNHAEELKINANDLRASADAARTAADSANTAYNAIMNNRDNIINNPLSIDTNAAFNNGAGPVSTVGAVMSNNPQTNPFSTPTQNLSQSFYPYLNGGRYF